MLSAFLNKYSKSHHKKQWLNVNLPVITEIISGGARGVMVIVVGNGHSDSSSNPGRD